MTNTNKSITLLFILFSTESFATDGYFSHGYGVKSQGLGGLGIAFPQDSLAAATNPAGLGLVGDQLDVGLTWFKPVRDAEISGNAFPGVDGNYSANDTKHFFIPEFGYNRQVNPILTLGLSVYGNGGMNTDYKYGIPLFGSQGRAGINLIQVFAAPTVTWKVTPSQTIGVSVNLAYQRFEIKGLQGFNGFSTSPNDLTNEGHDNSYGAGLHVGWIGQITENVSLGATYQSRTYMTKFDKYKGLFAEQGDFDIPSTYGLGLAIKATPKLTIAADYQRINYNEVDSVGNKSLQNLQNCLGADNGPGFGWKDANVYKLGLSYAYSDNLTLRAGLNHVDQPIRNSETLFNTLAPAVVKDHLSLGATWVLANKSELSFVYTHAFENKVNGSNSIPPGFPPSGLGGGEADLKMYQN